MDLFDAISRLCDTWALAPDDTERRKAHALHGTLLASGEKDDEIILGRVRELLEFRLGGPPDEPEVDG